MIPHSWSGRAVALAAATGAAALGTLAATAIGGAQSDIAQAADRLARFQAVAARPVGPTPFVAPSDDDLRTLAVARLSAHSDLAFRLEGLLVDPDPRHADARRLSVSVRGTADAVASLFSRLEKASPPLLPQRVSMGVVRPADADDERPTLLRADAVFTVFVVPASVEGRPASERRS